MWNIVTLPRKFVLVVLLAAQTIFIMSNFKIYSENDVVYFNSRLAAPTTRAYQLDEVRRIRSYAQLHRVRLASSIS